MKTKHLMVAILAIVFSASQMSAQSLVYGQTYKVENTWMNKAAYLDVNGQGCQDNYLCVSTTRSSQRKNSNTSDWIILSATGKKAGEPVRSGDFILLKNPWMRGSYLGTRGYSKDFGCPGFLCVSAWQNVDKVRNTTWQIKGDVKARGTIQLIGQWNNAKAGYLDINGYHSGGGFNVCTATDGRTKQSSTMWRFLPKGGSVAGTKNTLKAGETLKAGQKLTSANGAYILRMQQDDGNLCVYKYANGKQGRFVWGSMKYGFKNARLAMQTDGNLVVYDGRNQAKWSSETHPYFNAKFRDSRNKPVKLVLENDGKLKLYTASGAVVWSSMDEKPTMTMTKNKNTLKAGETLKAGQRLTSSNGAYILRMQEDDGNLCVYNYSNGKQGRFVWGSMKYGFKNARLVMQTDGNLVVYDGRNQAKWSSQTHPYFNAKFRDSRNKPVKLVLENDGKLKLYTASGAVVWSSK